MKKSKPERRARFHSLGQIIFYRGSFVAICQFWQVWVDFISRGTRHIFKSPSCMQHVILAITTTFHFLKNSPLLGQSYFWLSVRKRLLFVNISQWLSSLISPILVHVWYSSLSKLWSVKHLALFKNLMGLTTLSHERKPLWFSRGNSAIITVSSQRLFHAQFLSDFNARISVDAKFSKNQVAERQFFTLCFVLETVFRIW